MRYLWRDLPVTACQLDELWSFVHTQERPLEAAKLFCTSYGDAWVWDCLCATVAIGAGLGSRQTDPASANRLLERVAQVTTAGIPFFTSDQLAAYRTALLHGYGPWQQPVRPGNRGRFPACRRVPPPELLYAQVVKQRERGEVVAVTTKVVFGDADAITARLGMLPTSTTVNTSLVERENRTLRQHHRRLTRKTNGFSQELTWLEKQLWLSLAYYHLVLPHERLRQHLSHIVTHISNCCPVD